MRGGEPWTATSTFTLLLSSDLFFLLLYTFFFLRYVGVGGGGGIEFETHFPLHRDRKDNKGRVAQDDHLGLHS